MLEMYASTYLGKFVTIGSTDVISRRSDHDGVIFKSSLFLGLIFEGCRVVHVSMVADGVE